MPGHNGPANRADLTRENGRFPRKKPAACFRRRTGANGILRGRRRSGPGSRAENETQGRNRCASRREGATCAEHASRGSRARSFRSPRPRLITETHRCPRGPPLPPPLAGSGTDRTTARARALHNARDPPGDSRSALAPSLSRPACIMGRCQSPAGRRLAESRANHRATG